MGTNRLESFSDGVIAVAVTLLVLNISTPGAHPGHSLAHALLTQWPEYAAYATSFLAIGIIWINHHAMINRLREADHTILLFNLLLLMTIAVLPFATDLLAKHLHDSVAAAIYSGAFLVMAMTFSLLNRQILIVRAHLMSEQIPLQGRQDLHRRAAFGLVPYAVATPLAFVSPYITLVICAALAVFYATPLASADRPAPR
ncbi:MAG: TMEM175 family protein [Solirubrobacteraceae bacterium]